MASRNHSPQGKRKVGLMRTIAPLNDVEHHLELIARTHVATGSKPALPHQCDGARPDVRVESGAGAPALGYGGDSVAFAPGLSPAPLDRGRPLDIQRAPRTVPCRHVNAHGSSLGLNWRRNVGPATGLESSAWGQNVAMIRSNLSRS